MGRNSRRAGGNHPHPARGIAAIRAGPRGAAFQAEGVRIRASRAAWLLVLGLALSGLSLPSPGAGGSTGISFTFAAAGNIGSNANAAATLSRLGATNTTFFLALGDLSLNGTGSEAAWCTFVKSRVGANYPFELLSGDQEDNGPNGLIDNYTACLPDRLGNLVGTYGKEYYFDYPSAVPLARFIEISPGLSFTNGGSYTYAVATSHYTWLASAIDSAHAAKIPWVIVTMHKNCLTVSATSCDVGQDLIDLLAAKKVDLVLEAHSINYQRSKELSCGIRTFYVPECVANDGSTGTYPKGAGTVFVDAGTGGIAQQSISTTDSEYPYFVPSGLMGSKTAGDGYGFVRYTVQADRIVATTSFSKTYQDRFTIAAAAPSPAPAPTIPAARTPFTFAAMGDIGATTQAAGALARIPSTNSNFTLALGDLSYNGSGSEPSWCNFVSSRVGGAYPFELISGNHEDNGPDGLIDNFVKCLPDRIGNLNGTYGKEYSFDYPATSPLARFILISPAMSFTYGGSYSYSVANSHYTWLAKRIDDARAKGIPWVIVGFHEYCIAVGGSCAVGQDLQDLLEAKRVDLVLGGHYHVYERSKQLDCAIRSFYVPDCVSADGSNGFYPKGSGTVFSLVGTGGGALNSISKSDVSYPYFVSSAMMGSNTAGYGWGPMVFTVRPDRIDAASAFSGSFADRYTIATPLAADFTAAPKTTDAGAPVSFASSVAGGKTPYTAIWDFGDGTKATGLSVTHAYALAGGYNVTLQVYDVLGTVVSALHAVTVNPALAATFSFAPSAPSAGDAVTITASASGGTGPLAYAWDFGDGSQATGPAVQHAYASVGTYIVSLQVSDAAKQSLSLRQTVSVGPGLTAGFTFAPASPSAGDGVIFTGTAAGGTGPYSYSWDFGDGNRSTGPVAAHDYGSAGTYPASLTVTDAASHVAIAEQPVIVSASLASSFSVAPSNPAAGDNVTFTASASGGTGPYGYAWDFGDGNTSSDSTAIHAYATAGTYNATLTVKDSAGHASAAWALVIVTPPLTSTFALAPLVPVPGENVTFTSAMSGGTGPYSCSWDFGDGNTSSECAANHSYAAPGLFNVTLVVADAAGHRASSLRPISVAQPFSASFAMNPLNATAGENLTFNATLAGGAGPYNLTWDFGDGNVSYGDSALHAFATAGTFTITLTATDAEGRLVQVSETVLVG